MSTQLNGKKVAVLATNGFEESELLSPVEALREAGAEVTIVSPESGGIRAWDGDDWGKTVQVDLKLSEADPSDFNALVLPGGQMNPDTLRINDSAISFIKKFAESGKPIGAICHAPWLLITAGIAKGRELTSWPSLREDLENAGAKWVDQEVVCDQGIVTSRNPGDLPAFNAKIIEEIAEGRHDR